MQGLADFVDLPGCDLNFSLNVANIFNQPDRAARLLTGYFTDVEYYGTMVQFGLRYTISSIDHTKD